MVTTVTRIGIGQFRLETQRVYETFSPLNKLRPNLLPNQRLFQRVPVIYRRVKLPEPETDLSYQSIAVFLELCEIAAGKFFFYKVTARSQQIY